MFSGVRGAKRDGMQETVFCGLVWHTLVFFLPGRMNQRHCYLHRHLMVPLRLMSAIGVVVIGPAVGAASVGTDLLL